MNSSPPSATYLYQWIRSALVLIMACRLFSAKPLSKPMLGYCQLDPQEQTSVKIQNFSFTKYHLKTSSVKWRPFLSRGRGVNKGLPHTVGTVEKIVYNKVIYINSLLVLWSISLLVAPSLGVVFYRGGTKIMNVDLISDGFLFVKLIELGQKF